MHVLQKIGRQKIEHRLLIIVSERAIAHNLYLTVNELYSTRDILCIYIEKSQEREREERDYIWLVHY